MSERTNTAKFERQMQEAWHEAISESSALRELMRAVSDRIDGGKILGEQILWNAFKFGYLASSKDALIERAAVLVDEDGKPTDVDGLIQAMRRVWGDDVFDSQ